MLLEVVLLRLFLSAFMAAAIGIEREIHRRAAGLRTHILVALGSTLFMMTSIEVASAYGVAGQADPSRIAAGVVTGIGFLGAGAIIRYGSSIKGLTTAASIWVVAAIGLAVGAGVYWAAAVTTALSVTVLVLSRIEERMELKKRGKKADDYGGKDDIFPQEKT
jgi:putative Mg2+ transporter-C (MgtC) family protein